MVLFGAGINETLSDFTSIGSQTDYLTLPSYKSNPPLRTDYLRNI